MHTGGISKVKHFWAVTLLLASDHTIKSFFLCKFFFDFYLFTYYFLNNLVIYEFLHVYHHLRKMKAILCFLQDK